jgi:hypothetical protein
VVSAVPRQQLVVDALASVTRAVGRE